MIWIKSIFSRLYHKIKRNTVVIYRNGYVSINSTFEGHNRIGENTIFAGTVGYATNIADNCSLTAEIGRYTSIGSRVYGLSFNHPTIHFVSTHPAFYSLLCQSGFTFVNEQYFDDYKFVDREKKIAIKIGNDVWIGSDVVILGGVEIGDGAIVAAGTVVTKNVEPYSIVGGNPSKLIRYRFQKDEIEFLQKLEWWNKPKEWLLDKAILFQDIKILMKDVKENEDY